LKSYFALCPALLSLAAVGCGGAADIPPTPDVRALLASYDAPDGELDATRAGMVIADAPPMPELAAGLRATGFIADDVNTASHDSEPQTGAGVRLQGSVRLQIRCPGDLGTPNYDPSVNGSASITIAVADSRIKRTFGGQADGCVLRGMVGDNAVRIQLDGRVVFDLGGDVGIGQRWSGKLFAYLPGELEVGSFSFQSISARFTPEQVEHLVRLDDGTSVILTFTASGISVRDKSGTWYCPTGQNTCSRG
jgi:hypothetical protein